MFSRLLLRSRLFRPSLQHEGGAHWLRSTHAGLLCESVFTCCNAEGDASSTATAGLSARAAAPWPSVIPAGCPPSLFAACGGGIFEWRGVSSAAMAIEKLVNEDPTGQHTVEINKKITSIYKKNMVKLLKLRDTERLDSPDGKKRVNMIVEEFTALLTQHHELMDSVNMMTMFHRFAIVTTLFPSADWIVKEYHSFLGNLLGKAYHKLDSLQTHHTANFMLGLKHLMPYIRGIELDGATLEEFVDRIATQAVKTREEMMLKNISHTIAGVACFGVSEQDFVIQTLLEAVPPKLGGTEVVPADISLLIWGLGKAQYKDGSSVISQLLDAAYPRLEGSKSQTLIDIIWGLGELEFGDGETFVDKAVTALVFNTDVISAMEAVDLIVGLSKLKCDNARLKELLDNLCPSIRLRMHHLDSVAAQKLVQALNALDHNPGDAFWSALESKAGTNA